MAEFSLSLEGDKALLKAFAKIGDPKTQRAISTKAVRAASTPIRKAMRRKAPVGETGALKQYIDTRIKGYRSGNAIGVTGPRNIKLAFTKGGKSRLVNPSTYGQLVEFGTKPHVIQSKSGKWKVQHPGAAAKPFMRPAWVETKDIAQRKLAAKYWEGIRKMRTGRK